MARAHVEAIDSIYRVETPEGIELELQAAGLHPRACAWTIDLVIRIALVYIAQTAFVLLGRGLGAAMVLISYFFIESLYPIVFELLPMGATPGKRALGLRVVMTNGLPVTPAASFTRNLLRAADFLPGLYAVGAVTVLCRRDFRRLGDLVADTLVVHATQPGRRIELPGIAPVSPAIPLDRFTQGAVVGLAARSGTLTPQRLDEIAALAAAAHGGQPEASAGNTRAVLGVAQWLLGRRQP